MSSSSQQATHARAASVSGAADMVQVLCGLYMGGLMLHV